MPTGIDNNNKTPNTLREVLRSGQWMLVLSRSGLVLVVVASALGVAYLSQANRHLFREAEDLRREEAALDARWSRLLLERGTLINQARLERRAQQLGMFKPASAEVVVVR